MIFFICRDRVALAIAFARKHFRQLKPIFLCLFLAAWLLTIGLGACDRAPDASGSSKVKKTDSGSQSQELIVLEAWTIGPDEPSITRKTNLENAVFQLNNSLTKEEKKIQLKADFWQLETQDYRRKLNAAFRIGEAPDIIASGHEDIAILAESGYLEPLDEYIKQDATNTFKDFFAALWQSVTYKGKIYAIPQDTEVRFIFYRKDILRQLGWSEAKIAALPRQAIAGKVTLFDLVKIAAAAKQQGLVEWGIAHGATPDLMLFQYVFAFGGEIQDSASGKLVLDKSATLQALQFFHDLVYKYRVTPPEMANISWGALLDATAKGKALFQITAGSWQKAELTQVYGLTEAAFRQNIGIIPVPPANYGGKPVATSHPIVYFINKNSAYRNLAFKILTLASSVELNLKHALGSGHLAIRKTEAEMPAYKNDGFLVQATSFLQYARFAPNHSKYTLYETAFFESIQNVELNNATPEAALAALLQRVKTEIGDDMLIKE